MSEPWVTWVHCQGPNCDKQMKVNGPGQARPGWVILIKQGVALADKPPQVEHFPFCGLACAYNWLKARLPSKAKDRDDG